MNRTPTADTQSPWYEPFAPDQESPDARWLPRTEFPTRAAAVKRKPVAAEEQWTTDALFECYNG